MAKLNRSERIETGIEGFDKLILGGFPRGSNILVSGGPGTGKTIFSLEYLYNGAKKKEVGIYFTFEEKKESLFKQAIQFGWDLEKLEKKGLLKIISIGSLDISKQTINDMCEIVASLKAKRVVVDSLTTLSFITPENADMGGVTKYTIKNFLHSFITRFTTDDVTTFFISQKDEKISNTVAEYLCDGILKIEYESLGGDYSRNVTIPKMRKTKNNEDLHPMEIRDGYGIVIHDLD